MTKPIFPTSPVPAGVSFEPKWNSQVHHYDSGVGQGASYWSRPLYTYRIPFRNIAYAGQSSLQAFFNARKGTAESFFMSDPNVFNINSVQFVSTGTSVATLYLYDTNSFRVYPASGNLTITSALSGTLTEGTHFSIEHNTGIIDISGLAPDSADYWTATSVHFFKNCRFSAGMPMNTILWQQYSFDIMIDEEA